MTIDARLIADRFPRASRYHPDWVLAAVSGGANPLWLTEWLTERLDLEPGMRVLDLGCGRALSSIFLAREFGVQVWAVDLWHSVTENWQRVRDAGVEGSVFPLYADARALPFADEFFDAIVSIDSLMFYGTDSFYLNYVARFLKPRAPLATAMAGLVREIDGAAPAHLEPWFTGEGCYLRSADWWRRHWELTGIVKNELADTLDGGWRYWLDWLRLIAPENKVEIGVLEADQGQHLGYVRNIARRKPDAKLFDASLRVPADYTRQPLLRSDS
jgi:cyclopropane fatty-acyl-phospholipid synthase-like methyltransferase